MLCLHQGILQCLRLLALLLDALRNLLFHHHNHDIARSVVLCHEEGLAHTNLLIIEIFAPILDAHFRLTGFKAFL